MTTADDIILIRHSYDIGVQDGKVAVARAVLALLTGQPTDTATVRVYLKKVLKDDEGTPV